MGVHHPYRLDLCADDEDPFQLIIRPGWDAPHVRCFPRTFRAWPCLLRQVGTVLGSPYDYVVAGLAYANPGSRHNPRSNRGKVEYNPSMHTKQGLSSEQSNIAVHGLLGCGGTWLFGCHLVGMNISGRMKQSFYPRTRHGDLKVIS